MAEKPKVDLTQPARLRDALRAARIESAERTGVVVDLHDAEIARLELMNEMLDPIFTEIPPEIEFFDRGISRGDPPRLWVDMVAYIMMGRDKRQYRLMQDTRYGPKVLTESQSADDIAKAVTAYIARRIIERERALATDDRLGQQFRARFAPKRRLWRELRNFVVGLVLGVGAVLLAAWVVASRF